jgi:hypothetical protein
LKRQSSKDFKRMLDALIQQGPEVKYSNPDKWSN